MLEPHRFVRDSLLDQKTLSCLNNLFLLDGSQGIKWMTEFMIRARLNLDKNDHPSLFSNDIYFPQLGTEVFFKNPVTFLF